MISVKSIISAVGAAVSVCKRYAYEGGPRVLEELLSGHDATVSPPPPGQSLSPYWSRQLAASVTRRSAAAIGEPNLSSPDMQLIQLAMKLNSCQAYNADDDRLSDYANLVAAVLQNWQFLTGRAGWEQQKVPISKNGIEPQVSHLMRAAADPEFAAQLEETLQRPLNRPVQDSGLQRALL